MSDCMHNETLLHAIAIDFKRYREDDLCSVATDIKFHYWRSLMSVYFLDSTKEESLRPLLRAYLAPAVFVSWAPSAEVFNLVIPAEDLLKRGEDPNFLATFQGENALIEPGGLRTKLEVPMEKWNKKGRAWRKNWKELAVTDMPHLSLHIININNALHSFYTM